MTSKLHIGAGTNFLRGYINIDIPSKRTFLAQERPDLVEKYITEESDYYGRHANLNRENWHLKPQITEYVCDRYGSWGFIPCADEDASEILSRQVFEHLGPLEAKSALREANRVLINGGTLRLDVPDFEKSLDQLRETRDTFFIRHMLGPRNSPYGYHTLAYRRDGLKDMVINFGFTFVTEEQNIHSYPAFCLQFKKDRNVA